MGSAVVVDVRGMLLTVTYVVIGGRQIPATLPDGRRIQAEHIDRAEFYREIGRPRRAVWLVAGTLSGDTGPEESRGRYVT